MRVKSRLHWGSGCGSPLPERSFFAALEIAFPGAKRSGFSPQRGCGAGPDPRRGLRQDLAHANTPKNPQHIFFLHFFSPFFPQARNNPGSRRSQRSPSASGNFPGAEDDPGGSGRWRGDLPSPGCGSPAPAFLGGKTRQKLSGLSREGAGLGPPPAALPGPEPALPGHRGRNCSFSRAQRMLLFLGTGAGSPRLLARPRPGLCLLGQGRRFWLKGFSPRWLN